MKSRSTTAKPFEKSDGSTDHMSKLVFYETGEQTNIS